MGAFLRNFRQLFLASSFLLSCSEKGPDTGFVKLSPRQTGIHFSNTLTQDSEFNIIEYLYFYNGGGVALGDINNDGLTDIFLTANQLPDKLYLNKGDMVFEDITTRAGVAGEGNWTTGATMADVNGDGYLDIFVCGVGNYKNFNGRNRLYVNRGDLTFTDETESYGLAFQGFSTHASFFDYDNDGDLDMYLLNHSVHTARSYGHSRLRFMSDPFAGDKLYRNDLIPGGKNKFTEVTSRAGIYNSQVGYGLGVGVSDLNLDGFMDVYVSNDFHENDYMYLNLGDGTFSERLAEAMPHVSRFSMGNDIADINNDGLSEVITLDMLPKDENIIKSTAGEDAYDIYDFKLRFGYHHQFARNTLQVNHGVTREGKLFFSDVAPLAGIEASDWSWAPLLADFDNDGKKDLFIANGILTRPNDLDYINFISSDSAQRHYGYEAFIENMPSGKVPNYFYRNRGDFRFEDVSHDWIGQEPTLSTGAAYADLDNDGDLDLVINNVNAPAGIYQNNLASSSSGWLQIELKGEGKNTHGIGAKIIVYAGNQRLYQEQIPSRGWQSSVSPVIHVGVGNVPRIDSVRVIWPDKRFQTLTSVRKDRRITLFQKDATGKWDYRSAQMAEPILTGKTFPAFEHKENDFNAFSSEKLIPHMVSTQGPKISVGDANGDGREDFFIGGAAGQSGELFLQQASGEFLSLHQPALKDDALFEDTSSAFLDADGNGTLDLFVVGGGQEHSGNHASLQPRLYLNDGSGKLHRAEGNVPNVFLNGSCISISDVDGDGDPDVFIGGRVIAGAYGVNPKSYLFINDGDGNFRDESARLSAKGNALGMVSDARWCDVNVDGRPDLVVVGEWMPITILIQNIDGTFTDETQEYGLANTQGWWNTIEAADFDGDGDVDFVAGNLGLNSRLRATDEQPVTLYAGDIDQNGGMDHLLTYYNEGIEHPFISRDQLVKQVPSFRRAFLKYANFKNVRTENIIPASDTERYTVKQAHTFASMYLENNGGKFASRPLPIQAQTFPVFALRSGDFNRDGIIDLLAAGNLYAVQPDFGRYDAGYGIMLVGDGKGNFEALPHQQSGFLVEGETRHIEVIRSTAGHDIIIVARNSGHPLMFE